MTLMLWMATLAWFGPKPSEVGALDLEEQRTLVNKGIIGILGDGARGTDFALIADLAAVLDRGYEQRILPIAGIGSVRAVEDLLLLRGIDVAFVQADVLDFYKQAELFPDIGERIRYLAKLYDKEFHVLASKDITSIDDLKGRRVNFGPASSGSFLTASLVFGMLGIAVDVVDDDYQIALEKLRQGEIDAWVRVDAKPTLQLEDTTSLAGLHLLSLPASSIDQAYTATALTAGDYPGLIENGASVDTLAVPTIMAVYAWPRNAQKRARLRSFYDSLRDGISRLQQAPFHEKWRDVNLDVDIPGWERF
ncbi:MAG: TAXI family TRAP transporter solute-binding subunit [Geminicoccaceae bacterium]